jgi:hypothetical protein
MRTRFQSGQTRQQRPMWLRTLAMVCLVVLSVASTVQVCHVHAEQPVAQSEMHGATNSGSNQDSSPGDPRDSRQTVPDHCPLCVAMHSALPATAHTAPEPVRQVQAVLLTTVQLQRVQRWSFDLFSRPPPVVSFQA